MRSRRIVAAAAGVGGAVLAHALDVAGLLPFVHESAQVRNALSPTMTVGWLAITAALAAMTAARPATAGAGAALLIGGLPELAGRLDPGAMLEPAAIAGALLQWLLLVLVLSLAFALHTRFTAAPPAPVFSVPSVGPPPRMRSRRLASRLAARSGRTRAPPLRSALVD
jgi:hypothetical protein